MSIQFYVLGGPRYKPPGVSRGSPRLHLIIMFMLMFVCCCCCDRNKVQFKIQKFKVIKCVINIVADLVENIRTWGVCDD